MSKKSSSSSCTFLMVPIIALLVGFPAMRTLQAGNSLMTMIPNALLFGPFREETRALWKQIEVVDKSKTYEHKQIPIIPYEEYTFEKLKEATDGWRHPAIVRGLFLGSEAEKKWKDPEYLSSRIGDFIIPVVSKATYNTLQNERELLPFRTAYTEIVTDPDSKKYMFFPVESRQNFNHSDVGTNQELKKRVNDVVREDLDLDRIWKGFGGPGHSTFYTSQIIVGRGSNTSEETTGTGWHCAAGNNWFAQVTGSKRWYFMDQEYSSMMSPLRGGKVNMQTGNRDMASLHPHIPLRFADIIAGDLLYNPDWEWHTIKNYEGLSIGVPIREVNISLSLQNNFQYSSITIVNKVLDYFGIDVGGYAPSA